MIWFEKHDVARNELLELKVDDLYKAGLPFLVAKKLETQLMQLRRPFTFKLIMMKSVDRKGLKSIDDNCDAPKVIISLSYIHTNQHYRINAFHLKAVTINAIKSQRRPFIFKLIYNDEDEPLERFEKYSLYNDDDFNGKDTINAIKKPNKTFYIQAYNGEGELLERFETYTMYNKDDFRDFLKAVNGKAINHNSEVIRSLSQIRPNQHYRINDSYLKKEATWSIIEDQTMEEETLLAVQNALIEKINGPTKIFSKLVMFDQEGKSLIEWDVILICEDRVFLCEAKHYMTLKRIYNLVRRLQDFPKKKKLEAISDLEFKQLLRKQYIGVVCG
ncbi:15100_t:CDS:2 [Gigaspora margarita]|uniref:15100_t:CDS:1 n=1 Tax=Gigaspora margarita TaxID=4874 RepID=A0ABN7W1V6_GIGMA|nr:15100_t:CDS:2 [Gigaspora margarita]